MAGRPETYAVPAAIRNVRGRRREHRLNLEVPRS